MRRYAHIFSLLFLCIYGMVLLHNTVPHVEAEASEHVAGQTAHHPVGGHHGHHSHHAHHHHSGSAHDGHAGGLLGFLIDFLGSINHDHEAEGPLDWYLGATVKLTDAGPQDLVPQMVAPVSADRIVPIARVQSHVEAPPSRYKPPDRRLLPQRGPPSFS